MCAFAVICAVATDNAGIMDFPISFGGFVGCMALWTAVHNSVRLSEVAPSESEKRSKVTWQNDWDNDEV